jgi:hypothetical protein
MPATPARVQFHEIPMTPLDSNELSRRVANILIIGGSPAQSPLYRLEGGHAHDER